MSPVFCCCCLVYIYMYNRYVLYKERNMLLTEQQLSRRKGIPFPQPQRLVKVRKGMGAIKQVLGERSDSKSTQRPRCTTSRVRLRQRNRAPFACTTAGYTDVEGGCHRCGLCILQVVATGTTNLACKAVKILHIAHLSRLSS
jgi:Mitochondrial 39-S ribosomal protein L47 (MRP-L47)